MTIEERIENIETEQEKLSRKIDAIVSLLKKLTSEFEIEITHVEITR